MKPDLEKAWKDFSDDDEIEIIEVVGLEEDSPASGPASSSAPDAGPGAGDDGDEDDGDAFVLTFDDDSPGDADSVELVDPGTTDAPPTSARRGPADKLSAQEARDRLVRLQADFENLVKRSERELDDTRVRATERLVGRLLPIVDSFERAVEVDPAPDPEAFRGGVVLIFRQLLDEMRKEGLRAIEAEGRPFDPALHEAVEIDVPGQTSYTVVEEVQRGYTLGGRLLRPSLVKVRHDPAEPHDAEPHEAEPDAGPENG